MCETPITISLQGEWGTGKTSFMNMVKEYSENNNYPLYFYTINAWQYSQFNFGEQLPLVMLKKLANDIDGNNKVYVYEKGLTEEEKYLASSRALRHLTVIKE